jgi:hypothetical protein
LISQPGLQIARSGNLLFDEWTETVGTERLIGAPYLKTDQPPQHVEMNVESCRFAQVRTRKSTDTA